MAFERKSQAALEFLTTYGWAFLIILIMIGTLAYFGILSPSKLLPNRCNFPAEFECVDYQIDATNNEVRLRLKNSVGETITVTALTESSEGTTPFACTNPANPVNWASGTTLDLTFTGCNSAAVGFVTGDKGKVLLTIDYYEVKSGAAYGKQARGEIYSTIV
ncbi:hypothetical protein HYW20_06435 [Candidatus Woesearchaeota archaeon]|nr:hypothetical protein [Candidatus Woesearchaeota archaeon]